jgi:hypothetical protein
VPPSLTVACITSLGDPTFFCGFDYFLCFPSTTSSSFNATRTSAMEVNLWCFASYLACGYNPWSVLSEHICLMTVSSTKKLSYSSSNFSWLLINKCKVDYSSTNMCFSFLVSWVELKLGFISNLTHLLEFG